MFEVGCEYYIQNDSDSVVVGGHKNLIAYKGFE
jgi:hypothetical protein